MLCFRCFVERGGGVARSERHITVERGVSLTLETFPDVCVMKACNLIGQARTGGLQVGIIVQYTIRCSSSLLPFGH